MGRQVKIVGTEVITVDYLTDEGSTYEITVDLTDVTNIPKDAELEIRELKGDEYDKYLADAAAELGVSVDDITKAKLFDITIKSGDDEIEPNGTVGVQIKLKNEFFDNATVVHFGEETEILYADTNENIISFETISFSIYAIVDGGETGDNARVIYKFHKYDNNQSLVDIDTQYVVQKSDLVDPGVPQMSEDQAFLGWTFNADLSGDSLTIDDIRTDFEENHSPVTEGDTVDVYAKIVNVRYLTYQDEKGVILKTEMVTVPTSQACETTVALAYTPYEGNEYFEGWKVVGDTSGTIYENGDTIQLSTAAGITLEPALSEGYWLLFDENDGDVQYQGTTQSSGAEYTAPVFYKTGQTTVAPAVPKRTGFTFLGWFTEAEGGTQYSFGSELTEETKLYAHWQINQQSTYTVIVWMQNVGDSKDTTNNAEKKYDYYTTRTLTGNIASTISVPTSNQYGTGISREGFHYSWNDNSSEKIIMADGSTVLNIYYDRNLITFRFYKNGNNTGAPGYNSIHNQTGNNITVMTGLYGQKLSDNGYSWPAGTSTSAYRWSFYTRTNSTSGMSYLGQFVYPEGYGLTSTNEVCFYYVGSASYYVEFYQQDINGNYVTGDYAPGDERNGFIDLGASNGGTFTFANKYNGFEVKQYRTRGYYGWNSWNTISVGNTTQVNSSMQIRYERKSYNLVYMDGSSTLKTESIKYEAPLASYASYVPENVPEGYYFDGWYKDSALTEKFDFANSTMPLDGQTVYAKWTLKRYRVVLDLGSEALADIENISFPGGEGTTQASTFRVDYDEMIQDSAIANAQWKDHQLIGWYTDPTFTTPFNFASGINDDVADMTYKDASPEERRGTDPINGRSYDDADGEHDDVVGKVTVYAKWREVVEGADGIHVKYINRDGSTVSYDPEVYYADKAEAVAQAAPSGDLIPEGEQFLYWVQLDKEGNDVDSETYFPGQTFNVMLKYAEKIDTGTYDDAGNKIYEYIVTLKAVYGAVESAESTKIIYNANGGTTTMTSSEEENRTVSADNTTVTIDPLQLNKDVELPGTSDFVREGYTLVGWSNNSGDSNTKIFDPGQKVAADEDEEDLSKLKYTSDNTLYAVWQRNPSYLRIVKTEKDSSPIVYLEGAHFTLYLLNEETNDYEGVAEDIISNSSSEGVQIENALVDGIYKLVETQAPSNHAIETATILFTVEGGIPASTNKEFDYSIVNNNHIYSLTVENIRTATINITKVVEGHDEDKKTPFHFTVSGRDVDAEIDLVDTVTDGNAYKHTETYSSVPYGSSFTVTEDDYEGFDVKYTVNGVETPNDRVASVDVNADVINIVFTNTRSVQKVSVLKVSTTDTSKGLPDAVFTLKKDGETLYTGLTTNDEGYLEFEGEVLKELETGSYTLEETEAPSGYNRLENTITFTVAPTFVSGTGPMYSTEEKTRTIGEGDDAVTEKYYLVTVQNSAGVELPHTGGTGTLLYTLSGLALILASALMYGFRMRRRERRLN